MDIPDDIIAFIDSHRICGESLRELAPRLPADDEELHRWLGEAIEEMEPEIFSALVLAAQAAGRRMKASYYPRAINLLLLPLEACAVAAHLEGDIGEAVSEALRTGAAGMATATQLCLLAADWCAKHREGRVPEYLRTRLYINVRSKSLSRDDMALTLAAARILQDDTLMGMVIPQYEQASPELRATLMDLAEKAGDALLAMFARPVTDYITPEPNRMITNGRLPMRRAVARIGSNEPCPCGSGKKYKRCCQEKDKERLRQSSEVSGKTWREARYGREPFLTAETMRKMSPADLHHIDVRKLKKEVVPWFFFIAAALMQFETCVRGFRALGWDAGNKDLRQSWINCTFAAALNFRRDALEALHRVLPDPAEAEALMEPIGHAVLSSSDPAAHLRVLEKIAHTALVTTDLVAMQKAALGLLHSECPSLGILAARSFIPLLARKEANFILEKILEVRDRLHLPAEDAYSDVLERRFASEGSKEDRDAESTRRVRRQLEAKASEVRNLRVQLEHLHHEVEKKERKTREAAPQHGSGSGAAPAADESLKDLRRKVGELKGLLQQRQEERSTLRSELEKAHAELEKTRAAATPAAAAHDADEAEDDLLLPEEPGTTQPVRIPSLPRHFHSTLQILPRSTARHAMETIGRLCGGEATAFHGVVRLKAVTSVFRIRIGQDYRLLFRLTGDTLEVVDLINRRDLEKRIRSLLS
jgi:SEC-C motif